MIQQDRTTSLEIMIKIQQKKKNRRSEAENMKRNQDVPISGREIGGENHNELKRSVPWAKTTNCSHREETTAVTERTVDYE